MLPLSITITLKAERTDSARSQARRCVASLPVVVDDGVQSVRDRQDRAFAELRSYGVLDECIGVQVDRRRRLVQHQNDTLPENRSRQTQQLTLTDAKQPSCHYNTLSKSLMLQAQEHIKSAKKCNNARADEKRLPKVLSSFSDRVIQLSRKSRDEILQMGQFQSGPELVVAVTFEWIQVDPKSPGEQNRVL